MKSNEDGWRLTIQQRLPNFEEVYGRLLEENWSETVDLGMGAEQFVRLGLDLLYHPSGHALAYRFLEHAMRYLDWLQRERAIERRELPFGLSLDWAKFYRARALAIGLTHHRLEPALLLNSAAAWESEINTDEDEGWSEVDEEWHLTAIRLRLIAGDLPYARELLARHRIYWNLTEAKALKALTAESTFPVTAPRAREAYREHFDVIRDPAKHGAGFERLEFGLIWDRYFVSAEQTIDWERAIEAIAE